MITTDPKTAETDRDATVRARLKLDADFGALRRIARSPRPIPGLWLGVALIAATSTAPGGRGIAVAAPPPDLLWTSPAGIPAGATPQIKPDRFRLFALDATALSVSLAQAPTETGAIAGAGKSVITIPMPDGSLARFEYVESPVMAPQLAARFPDIKTFLGQGLDDRAASVRFDWTPKGFHAQVLSPSGAVYVDPYTEGDTSLYLAYRKQDLRSGGPFSCVVEPGVIPAPAAGAVAGLTTSGDKLQTYRLAVAATGEYTQFHGGTVADGMAAIVTAINRVTGIYEVELAVRMVLIPNNDLLVFTNPATDPYTNNDGFAMLSQNQATITSIIGPGNYDIGHVFSTGGGGIAGLRVVCSNSTKAWGVTGQLNPIGDPFYVDFVAHEMGHQFGGNHTFNGVNGSCCCGNRHGSTAYEPGSGSTIMAYAGICSADDLQPHSDPYFHFASFNEIRAYVAGGFGGSCAQVTLTGNDPPTVNAGPNHTIPAGTPFVVTASATDLNGDGLTYAWEQADLGSAVPLNAPDNGFIPLFRSLNPTTESFRSFPSLASLLAGTLSDSEKLPLVSRTLDLRVTVRDNRGGGGGVAWDQMAVIVDDRSGPFRITSPTTGIMAGANQSVTWDVAGTDLPPVGTGFVNILLSTDAGATFDTVLAASTPNDGEETILMPDISTSTGRLKIEAVDNVFFDVSDRNLAVGSCLPPDAPLADATMIKNRYLSIEATPAPGNEAIRVTLSDLPPPFDTFNGTTMWVTEPVEVSENGASADPIPGFPSFLAATLSCTPFYADWSGFGTVQVSHELIVPSGSYAVQSVLETCDTANEVSFSGVAPTATAGWGDTVADCSVTPCSPPDGSVGIIDVIAILGRFVSAPDSIAKIRADLEPASPDRVINIADATMALSAFSGLPYPFAAPSSPCGP